MIALKLVLEGLGLGFLLYLICVYVINGARGFFEGFWQGFVILFIMNLIDRFLIDEYWVGYFYPWTGLLRFFPKDIEEKARLHQPSFPAAPVIG